jgi:hypothetical protein
MVVIALAFLVNALNLVAVVAKKQGNNYFIKLEHNSKRM